MLVYKLKTPPITQTHPIIAAQWHPTKNDRTVDSVTKGSTYRAWWLGSCGHKWQSTVLDRTHHESNNFDCPRCYSSKFGPTNHNWKGHGEISARYWNSIKNDAARRGYEFSITIEYAWNLFLKQNKKCTLTGYSLCMLSKPKRTASLDRIDNTRGYTHENVQWLHINLNKMKSIHSQDEFIELCCAVANHKNKTINRIMTDGTAK